MDRVEF